MNKDQIIRVMIVDDEPLARRGVKQALTACPEAEIIGEAGDAQAALPMIEKLSPDVVFLDIEMPGVSGLELAALITGPLVVFVTAFDEYAVAAFEARALDYLLKPIDPDRFELMWSEVLSRLEAGTLKEAGFAPHDLQKLNQSRGKPARLVLRENDSLTIVPLNSLIWIEAADNYVVLHTRTNDHLWRRSLVALEAELESSGFVRVHRSAIIRVDEVVEIKLRERGDFTAVLSNGNEVVGSRRYRKNFLEILEG